MKRHLMIAAMVIAIALFSGCAFFTNVNDEVKKEDILVIGSPLDETGSILHADQLFDRPCVYQEFVSVTADPNRPNSYLYTFRFFYRGDGSEYLSGGEETTLLTIHNCRKVFLSDYDDDGIVELFVQTESDEEPFMLYDMENGEITSCFVDEIPPTAPEPELTPELTPEPIPEPTLEPTPEPTPEPASEPTPKPTPEPTPNPIPEPTSETCAPKNTRLYVLMYHHFVPDGTECNPWTLTASRFREDLQWLSDNGYTTVLPSELAAGMELPEKAVMITLDDGYASNYDLAFPLLKEFNAKAVISLITSTLERTLTWDQCREMAQSGLVEFGSHTHAVHNTFSGGIQRLPDESQVDYETRIFPDIMTSIDLIEQNLSTKVQMFAYPYGKTDEWADQFMKDTFAITVNSISATASIKNDLYDLPRYTITMDTPLSMYLE